MIVNGDWLLLPERAAVHLPTATAVLADLHLGYSEARRNSGEALPLVSLVDVLAPLAKALERNDVRRILVAGDLFEAGYRPSLAHEFSQWVAGTRLDFLGVVPGNHDRHLARASFPILPDGFCLGIWRVLHGDQLPTETASESVVHGHWHPSLRWHGRKRPCFLVNDTRLVLPAYSLDAAGVSHKQIADANSFRWVMIHETQLVEAKSPKPKPVYR
jgi:putative SbcD/Mre11-related phosphoesterase